MTVRDPWGAYTVVVFWVVFSILGFVLIWPLVSGTGYQDGITAERARYHHQQNRWDFERAYMLKRAKVCP